MQVFIDKDREKKRLSVIRQTSSDPRKAQEILKSAGILTRSGKIAKTYRATQE